MKWSSHWWGVQILAEDKADEIVLRAFLERLPKKAHRAYDEGDWERAVTPSHSDPQDFTREEVAAARLLVRFDR